MHKNEKRKIERHEKGCKAFLNKITKAGTAEKCFPGTDSVGKSSLYSVQMTDLLPESDIRKVMRPSMDRPYITELKKKAAFSHEVLQRLLDINNEEYLKYQSKKGKSIVKGNSQQKPTVQRETLDLTGVSTSPQPKASTSSGSQFGLDTHVDDSQSKCESDSNAKGACRYETVIPGTLPPRTDSSDEEEFDVIPQK